MLVLLLLLFFLPIKLKMKFSNLNVDPMTHVGKDSGHVTCQGTGLVEHILPLL